jgi:Fe-S-cluster containining protein
VNLLNRPGGPCLFFSRDAEGRGVCDIYDTRPDVCRAFDCRGEGRQLIALGFILD